MLVTDNNQGELTPLEIGLHALKAVPKSKGGKGKKGGLMEYAKQIGQTQQYLSQVHSAATVVSDLPTTQVVGLLDKAKHLNEIHKAPRRVWPAIVQAMLDRRTDENPNGRTVRETKEVVITTASSVLRGLNCRHARTSEVCRELYWYRHRLWTILDHAGVEPTNNANERALRHAVIWRKLSFGTQSAGGRRFVETLLSVIETCLQQHRDVFAFITETMQNHLAHQSVPSQLPGV